MNKDQEPPIQEAAEEYSNRSDSAGIEFETEVSPIAEKNGKDDKIAMMSFNMPVDWHTKFKVTAIKHRMSMKDLLIESFEAWQKIEEYNEWRRNQDMN